MFERDSRRIVYRRYGERYSDLCVLDKGKTGWRFYNDLGRCASAPKMEAIVIRGNLNAVRYQQQEMASVVVPLLRANLGLQFIQHTAQERYSFFVRTKSRSFHRHLIRLI